MSAFCQPLRKVFQMLYARSSEKRRVAAIEDELRQWGEVPVYCGNVDEWHDYFDQNHPRIPDLTHRLKDGVDGESAHQIDLFLERFRYVFPPSRFQGHVRFRRQAILTPDELELAGQFEEYLKQEIPFVFPREADVNEKHLFWRRGGLALFDEDALKSLPGRDVIDGGAYCGETSMVFAASGAGRVYAFEPFPRNHEFLLETIRLNRTEAKVEAVRCALGAARSSLRLTNFRGRDGGKVVQVSDGGADLPPDREVVGETLVTTVDAFVEDRGLDLGLLKLDVEGAELDVVRGALGAIRKHRPLLVISLYHRPQDFFGIKPLIESEVGGYRFRFRYLSPVSPSNEFMLLGWPA